MNRKLVFSLTLSALTVLAGGLALFQFIVKPAMIAGFIAKAPPPAFTVAVEEARAESWTPHISVIGTFKAVQGIDMAPQAGGIIRAIRFDNGQDVAAGALLVEIDDATEQADLKSNVAILKNADLSLDRQRQLVAKGNTAQANVDSAQASRDQAAAALERTRALIAQKAVSAPFAGRLGIRKVDLGQYVAPGTSLVTLQQLDPIYLDFQVPEQNYAQLRVDQSVEASVDALPGATFNGKIATIDARVSQDTRNILVRAILPNPDKKLLPGMFANLSIAAGQAQQVVTLRRTGVAYSLFGDAVYVVKLNENRDGGVVERRFVRVGETRDERVAISEGVKAGETVVVEGQLKLQPGANVRVEAGSSMKPQAKRPLE